MLCKNALYSLNTTTILNNSLLQILQFNSSSISFLLQYAIRCYTLSVCFCNRYTLNTKSNISVSTFIGNVNQQIFKISSSVNLFLIFLNNSFYFNPYFYSLSFFIIYIKDSILSNYFIINLKNNYKILKIILNL